MFGQKVKLTPLCEGDVEAQLTCGVDHAAACLPDDDRGCSDVPAVQAILVVGLGRSAGHMTQC